MKKMILMGLFLVLMLGIAPSLTVRAAELTSEDYEALSGAIEKGLREGNLDSEEDIKKALEKAADKYDIEVSDKDMERVVDIMNTMDSLGIDKEKMADMVDDVYDKVVDGKQYESTDDMIDAIEDQVIDSATEKVKEAVKETVKEKVNKSFSDYISDFISRISEFIERIKALWPV